MLPVSLIFITGFAVSVGQILVLRELLVLFYGNELSTGLILACWLLWTAAGSGITGRILRNRTANLKSLFACLCILSLSLPATLLWIRAARAVWSVPVGELLSPGLMFLIALSSTASFCFLSGAAFSLAWSLAAASPGRGRGGGALGIYLAEAAGSGAGGLFYYFILLPAFPSFAGSLFLCMLLAASACAAVARERFPGKAPALIVGLTAMVLAGGLLGFSGRIDTATRHLQWGPGFLESRDTPYHNLAFLGNSGQFSLFCNGLWLYSNPDPQTAEPGAHLPLLQHARPENVLVMGDFSPGLLEEVLRHPGIRRVDCVQADPQLLTFAGEILPSASGAYSTDPRLRIHHTDPNRFFRSAESGYSVVIMGAGEPVNAEMNRFYTVEFFSKIKGLLGEGGVFSFSVPGAPDIIGPREALLLKSLKSTLDAVFESVAVVPGEGVRFFAGNAGAVTKDAVLLIERMRERKLDLQYLRDFHLFDWLGRIRLDYVDSVLRGGVKTEINRDFEPVCYLYGLGLWGAQLHPALGGFWEPIPGAGRTWFPAVLGMAIFSAALIFRAKSGPSAAITFNTAVCGALLILLEIILILAYQIINGAMYKQMALIISLFMAGIAVGGGIGRKVGAGAKSPLAGLFVAQTALAVYAGLLAAGISGLGGLYAGSSLTDLIFSLLAFIAGMLGGGQFALAVRARAGIIGEKAAGAGLYAADLIGAAGGAVLGSLFLLPVFGIPKTLLMLALAGVAGSVTLLGSGKGARL
ncbi:MAG: hypothetical protein WAW37_13645 [Syntrophobacteraceae bacterium]